METIETYVAAIQAAKQAEFDRLSYTLSIPTYKVATGKRFHKVIESSPYGGTSVHCFVEIATGDIYKAAGWNVPAKGVRGNIQNEKRPLLGYDYYR
jgi:hypothetical protein